MNEINEKNIIFLINRSLSYYQDCVLYSNEINRRFDTPAFSQYHYLLNSIRKKVGFANGVNDLETILKSSWNIIKCPDRKKNI